MGEAERLQVHATQITECAHTPESAKVLLRAALVAAWRSAKRLLRLIGLGLWHLMHRKVLHARNQDMM